MSVGFKTLSEEKYPSNLHPPFGPWSLARKEFPVGKCFLVKNFLGVLPDGCLIILDLFGGRPAGCEIVLDRLKVGYRKDSWSKGENKVE